jgi:hypothetical protein
MRDDETMALRDTVIGGGGALLAFSASGHYASVAFYFFGSAVH